jgi:outer membrane protein assembly factor BamB
MLIKMVSIFRGKKKGVMVPPVIVDVNNDGTDDILVSSYDGHLILLNGEDLTTIWTAQFPDMESYS